jgi:hypothetical protein
MASSRFPNALLCGVALSLDVAASLYNEGDAIVGAFWQSMPGPSSVFG